MTRTAFFHGCVVAFIATGLLCVGHGDALGQEPRAPAQQDSPGAFGKMPPQRLAKVVQQVAKDAPIAWGEAQDGLAVAVGEVRTSLKSPIWPVIDAYLENQGASFLENIIQSRARFLLELDGRFYAESDFGGISTPMAPGRRYGPIPVETAYAPFPSSESRPVIEVSFVARAMPTLRAAPAMNLQASSTVAVRNSAAVFFCAVRRTDRTPRLRANATSVSRSPSTNEFRFSKRTLAQ